MSTEDTQPPSSPGAPNWRRFWWVVLLLMLFNAAMAWHLRSLEPMERPQDLVVAERFLDSLIAGNQPMGDSSKVSGYSKAYDLLSEETRDEMDFSTFVNEFEGSVQEWGFFESWRKERREEGNFSERRLYYRLGFTGTRGHRILRAMVIHMVPIQKTSAVASFRIVSEDD